MTSRAMSILVHSDTKIGKSTFASTANAPVLYLDVEAAHRFLNRKMVFWDPMREAPPAWDGEWELCIVVVRDYMVMVKAFDWLRSGQHSFRSVVIDSISELQKRCKDQLRSIDEDMNQRKWGALLDHMEWLVRGLRDLTEHPVKPVEAVILTSMTTQRDGKWRPYVQGQLAVTMPYFLDVIGYMFVQEVQQDGPTGATIKMRRMLVTPHSMFEAGERVQGRLGDIVDNPTVPKMLDMVFGPEPSTEVAVHNNPQQ